MSLKHLKEYQEIMQVLDKMLYLRGKLHVVLGDTPIVKELGRLRVELLDIIGYRPEIETEYESSKQNSGVSPKEKG